MAANEMRKKKPGPRRSMRIAFVLFTVGLILVVTAVIMEVSHYPWGLLFGTATQNADVIPDPSPIILDTEDQDIVITAEIPTVEAGVTDAAPVSDASPETEASPTVSAELPGNTEATKSAPAVPKFVVLGTIKIPVLKVSQNLLEGAGKQMKYGVGHVPSTAAPGQKGNCAVSGHRPYPFRYLDQLKTGDNIIIKAGGVTYTYAVYESFDVLPTETWVLNSIPGEDYALTVITCTPYMVSSHRLIVRARLIDIDGTTPQEYYGDAVSTTSDVPAESTEPGEDISLPAETSVPASEAPAVSADMVTASIT